MEAIFQRFFKPNHDYAPVIAQALLLYFVYKLYKQLFVKPSRGRAYTYLEQDRVLKSYEGSEMERRDKEKVKKLQMTEKQTIEEQNRKRQEEEERKKIQQQQELEQAKQNNISLKELMKMQKHNKLLQGKTKTGKGDPKVQHRLFKGAVKGFSEEITSYSLNSKYMVVASLDHTIKIYPLGELFQDNPRFLCHNLFTGVATAICISQTENRIYYAASNQINVCTFNYEEKQFKVVQTFPQRCHKESVNCLYIDNHDRFLVTTSDDTFIKVWNMKGELLKEVNTSYGEHYHSTWNSAKNFLVISAKTSDTSIFEIKTNKDNTFKSIEKVILLRGESGKLIDASIDEKGYRASIASRTFAKFFNIHVEYTRKEDARSLKVFQAKELQQITQLEDAAIHSVTSFTSEISNKSVYLVGMEGNVVIFGNEKFDLLEVIPNATRGAVVGRMEVKQIKSHVMCFVLGEGENRMNVFEVGEFL